MFDISFSSRPQLQDSIRLLLKNITPHIKPDGKIEVHINQTYVIGYQEEDYIRQAFMYFTLCKLKHFSPQMVSSKLLSIVFDYIRNNYNTNQKLTALEKKYIEIYIIKASIFYDSEKSIFLENFISYDFSLVYSRNILVHLFLSAEADSLKILQTTLMPQAYLEIAKEAVFYSLKSEQKESGKAFQYVDIFYYNDLLDLDVKELAKKIVQEKLAKELVDIPSTYTSVFAKIFEGYTALYPQHLKELDIIMDICLTRRLKVNPYLANSFSYNDGAISEVEGTAYVCLDTYAHLILGLLNLYEKYDR